MSARFFAIAAGAAILASAAAMTSSPASAACRGFVQAHAEGTLKYPTELLSRARWRSEVGERYGAGYAFWSKSQDRRTTCTKSEPGEKWTCTSRGRPCD